MMVKGNHELDMKWADGKLSGAVLHSRSGQPVAVQYKNQTAQIVPTIGESIDVYKALLPFDGTERAQDQNASTDRTRDRPPS